MIKPMKSHDALNLVQMSSYEPTWRRWAGKTFLTYTIKEINRKVYVTAIGTDVVVDSGSRKATEWMTQHFGPATGSYAGTNGQDVPTWTL